jgi:6-pyruvoyltetrahydropterin/6-carboxytetrahydropterin synthase
MYSITKNFKFEASHRLFNMPKGHPCGNLHGHSYVVKVTISTEELNNQCMVTDFGNLKPFQIWLDVNFDHATILNLKDTKLYEALKSFDFKITTMPNGDPTAENMAELFCGKIRDIAYNLKIDYVNISIEVFETVGNSATYTHNVSKN